MYHHAPVLSRAPFTQGGKMGPQLRQGTAALVGAFWQTGFSLQSRWCNVMVIGAWWCNVLSPGMGTQGSRWAPTHAPWCPQARNKPGDRPMVQSQGPFLIPCTA